MFKGLNPIEFVAASLVGVVLGVILLLAFLSVLAYPLAAAWNGSVPAMFGLPKVGWGEAFAIQVLLIFVRGMPIRLQRNK